MAVSTAFTLRETRLDCLRELGKQARCVLTESPPLPHVARYSPGAIGAVNVVQKSRSKGGKYWDVMILDLRGAEQRLASYGDQASAEALAMRLRAFLTDPRAARFSFVPPRHWLAFLYLAFGVGMFLLLLWHGVRDSGHLLVDIDRVHAELRVRRRLFGVSSGKQARYRLAELRDIELEHGNVRNAFAARGQLPEAGARLSAVRNSGHRFPLTQPFLPSPQLFETGLELLRAELGFADPEPAEPSAQRLSASPEQAFEPALAHRVQASIAAKGASQRTHTWLLAACAALVVVTTGALATWHWSTREAQLEIQAEYRCQFDGIEILPGGVMSTSLAPGHYQVLVFDTAVAGGWQSQPFELRAGETKLIACRPQRPGVTRRRGDSR
jgi:hypothetical protein